MIDFCYSVPPLPEGRKFHTIFVNKIVDKCWCRNLNRCFKRVNYPCIKKVQRSKLIPEYPGLQPRKFSTDFVDNFVNNSTLKYLTY